MSEEVSNKTIAMVAWCNMKLAECEREVAMAKAVGMENLAAPFARDARFYRAIAAALTDAAVPATTDCMKGPD